MHTERVTILASPAEKRWLTQTAAKLGISTAEFTRRAWRRYGDERDDAEVERELELLLPEAEAAVVAMNDDIAAMREMIAQTQAMIAAVVEADGVKA